MCFFVDRIFTEKAFVPVKFTSGTQLHICGTVAFKVHALLCPMASVVHHTHNQEINYESRHLSRCC